MAATYDRRRQNELIMRSKSAYLRRHYGDNIRIVEDAKETKEALNHAILPVPGHLAAANKVPLPALRAERTMHDTTGNLVSKSAGRRFSIEQSGFVDYSELLESDINGFSKKARLSAQATVPPAQSAVNTTPAVSVSDEDDISILDVLED